MADESQNGREGRNVGEIVEIRGVVLDVRPFGAEAFERREALPSG